MNAYEWFGVAMALLVFGFGLYKWIVSRGDQARANVNNAQDRALEAHAERLDRHREQLNRLDDLIQITRDEMSRTYVRLEHLEKLEQHIRDIEKSIDGKLEKLHIRVGSVARDVNQTIGKLQQSHDNEITNMVAQIKQVLESRV